MNLALRLARRELRGGLAGFRIFIACLTLGVAVIAGVGSLSASLDAALRNDARTLLGGDVDFHLFHRPASAAERAYLDRAGRVSEADDMRAMARNADGSQRSLIQLKAVDAAYPLYGSVTLDPPQTLSDALALRDGHWGAVAAEGLFQKLGVKPGDLVRIGDGVFQLRAVLVHEPDALSGTFDLGPKVTLALPALPSTGLIQPGALVGYGYRVRLPPGGDEPAFAARIKADLPDAAWRIRGFADAAPSLQRLLDRLTVFLTLVGLTALLVGGVGIGNAVRAYLNEKLPSIAALKCLGASRRLVFTCYLLQVLALAAAGIALGLVLGAAMPFIVAPFLPSSLPVGPQLGLYWRPLATAALDGLLATLAFALWPLGIACEVRAASLFRLLVEPPGRAPPGWIIAAIALSGLGLGALAVLTAPERVTSLWFVAGAAGALLAFQLLARGLMALARILWPRRASLRLALANLHRPGAPTSGVVASLGLGLAVLVAIVLVRGNAASEFGEIMPQRAPSFFFIDIQPDQVADFDKLLATMPGVEEIARMPSLRGRIDRLNGVPVEKAQIAPEAEWAVRSERGLTYAALPPEGSRVVEGQWWPKDYNGPPLISLDANLARGMNLKPGDTMTLNVLGRELTATLSNLREIDWTSLGLNFAIVLSPGTLEGAPETDIATARTAPENETALETAVTDRFPNVSAIAVRDVLTSLSAIVDAIARAMTAAASIAIAAGVLVLAGAIAAGRKRRIYEAVLLKVLGAERKGILKGFIWEYGLLGAASAALAGAIGTLMAYVTLTRIMHVPWQFLPLPVTLTLVLAVLAILAFGWLGTGRALAAKAADYLRNE
ncbi:MAG: FtsX-like permease family protein [Stellaceae bacterium]